MGSSLGISMKIISDKLTVGILAHVDAGKTTLAEAILYLCGNIRKLGRVDHKDTFLDTYELERKRGITIFSKQALVTLEDKEITLLDTPGHIDFSAEMERTLQVLDYAILVISGADGIQGHVETLWRLLKRYQIPVFLFINKMDQQGTNQKELFMELQKRLDERCVDFGEKELEKFWDSLAMCEENLMNQYLDTGKLETEIIAQAIAKRQVFPCFFGSALKLIGIEEFLKGIETYTKKQEYSNIFGARVFKIARDTQGNRLTYLKITGGSLKVKTLLTNAQSKINTNEYWQEKADQIRIYSGTAFQITEEAAAGTICAVTGLSKTYCGQGLGEEKEAQLPLLEPVLTYQILLPEGCDTLKMLRQLRQLEEEEPLLHIVWKESLEEIHAQVMGNVQMEILQNLVKERFHTEITFCAGSIVYKETIAGKVEGIGHFEPLRHYAEVHLLMEPGERGSGLQFDSRCSEDELDRNWQRLILTHLEEKIPIGVLTGSEITDMHITLVAGRAHIKHTEGGDFRQATYRAVRQGLKKAQSILLEPIYEFMLELPTQMVGRAITDIQRMKGSLDTQQTEGEVSILIGTAPVATMQGYQKEVIAYTKGHGRFTCTLKGYEPCHNQEEVIAEIGYDSESDLDNPTSSVFCAHGAGFIVTWDKVEDYAHVDSGLKWEKEEQGKQKEIESVSYLESESASNYITQEEIEEIFQRTYGTKKKERNRWNRNRKKTSDVFQSAEIPIEEKTIKAELSEKEETESDYNNKKYDKKKQDNNKKIKENQEEYLLVDGYNIIFAWKELKELAQVNIESARGKLMDILSNYQGWIQSTVILVFDAYKVKGNLGTIEKYHNIYIVYTKEAETADQYIEKTVHSIGKKYHVTVATSDALEQLIIWGQGATRLSAMGLKEEIEACNKNQEAIYPNSSSSEKSYPFRDFFKE